MNERYRASSRDLLIETKNYLNAMQTGNCDELPVFMFKMNVKKEKPLKS